MADQTLANDNRLRWQCRRGMLELDLLLQQFLDQGYPKLDQPARRQFARLLEYPDKLLFEWLVGKAVPADREVRNIVQSIRHTLAD